MRITKRPKYATVLLYAEFCFYFNCLFNDDFSSLNNGLKYRSDRFSQVSIILITDYKFEVN